MIEKNKKDEKKEQNNQKFKQKLQKIKKNSKKLSLYSFIAALTYISVLMCLFVFYLLNIFVYKFNIYDMTSTGTPLALTVMLLISLCVAVGVSFLFSRTLSRPIENLCKATNEVAKGNFNVKLEPSKNDTINKLVENFNQMTKDLQSIESLQADFISNVSHEFKTPLNVIQSYAKMLKKKDLDEETRNKYEQVLENNIKKLSTLTSSILNLSKLENQRLEFEKTTFALDEEIRQSILALTPEWESKHIDFDLDLDPIEYFGAKELLAQVWNNLINNAIKYSYDGGKIFISLKKDEGLILINVTDNGIGMDEDTVEHIFDKFYQADSSHYSVGNGLGLPLVKQILDICNGEIFVESTPKKGSTFIVSLI